MNKLEVSQELLGECLAIIGPLREAFDYGAKVAEKEKSMDEETLKRRAAEARAYALSGSASSASSGTKRKSPPAAIAKRTGPKKSPVPSCPYRIIPGRKSSMCCGTSTRSSTEMIVL